MIAAREIMHLSEVDRSALPLVGGKGANLGAMLQAGFPVPPGFCLTTEAYRLFTAPAEAFIASQLSTLSVEDTQLLNAASIAIREHLEALPIWDELSSAIGYAYEQLALYSRTHHLLPPDAGAPPSSGAIKCDCRGFARCQLCRPAGHHAQCAWH